MCLFLGDMNFFLSITKKYLGIHSLLVSAIVFYCFIISSIRNSVIVDTCFL